MQSEGDRAFLRERMVYPSEEDLSCSVCQDIYKDPVVLSCSHIFCQGCLKSWWVEKQTYKCPVCEEVSLQNNPPVSPLIRNLCEAFLQKRDYRGSEDSGALCSLHFEKLKLFCLDHQQPVCVVCLHSKAHTDHRFSPIDEAAQDNKELLQNFLKPLQKKLELIQEFKLKCDETDEQIKNQAQHTEKQIREHFEKLHQFLQEEEEGRITALREEEELKSQMMKEKIEALKSEISALSDTIRDTEEELRAKDVLFLQNYKVSVEKVQQHPLLEHPELVSEAKIDVAKHLGNLTFNIWNKIKQMVSYSPVILDPNTTNPELPLNKDLSSMSDEERQDVPENTYTDHCCMFLGPDGSTSGTHSWDVEIEDNKDCVVGVLESSETEEDKVSGLWRIWLFNDEYTTQSLLGPTTSLPVKKIKKIRVHLDWTDRKLSFSDADAGTPLQTFTHTFTDGVIPCAKKLNNLQLMEMPEKEKTETCGEFKKEDKPNIQ
ncbi:Zinc-binding protein A33 [Channa argus]|uniref:Zinc-binding protein A33 n=1 Tax=Channa argus TaxID=215402 RepID=A0A6G1PJB0_CHAAH|nr:Zinc-binding protein A33 [Channa argus]